VKRVAFFIILAIFALFGATYFYLGLQETETKGWFLNENEVNSIDVVYRNQNYTLNYAQQKKLCTLLNLSEQSTHTSPINSESAEIQTILIYLFEESAPLTLTPASNDYSLFKVSTWQPIFYLAIEQPLELKRLIETTYDT
jgi:hypothetical protein